MSEQRTVRLVGGPCDGLTLDGIGPPGDGDGDGTWMVVDGSTRRAAYEPDEDGHPDVWLYRGDLPASV